MTSDSELLSAIWELMLSYTPAFCSWLVTRSAPRATAVINGTSRTISNFQRSRQLLSRQRAVRPLGGPAAGSGATGGTV